MERLENVELTNCVGGSIALNIFANAILDGLAYVFKILIKGFVRRR